MKTALVLMVLVSLLFLICTLTAQTGLRKTGKRGVSGKVSSIVSTNARKSKGIRIRVVHHGNDSDLFWADVHKGIRDAEALLENINVELVMGTASMLEAIKRVPSVADGLIVTCPYINTDPNYADIDAAIKQVIAAGYPVITFNTDTYHNPNVFQYVGSSNKILGKRGAITALKKYPDLLPDDQDIQTGTNMSLSCEEKVELVKLQCKKAGNRKVSHVIGILQEKFNVTLDWRIEEFHKEWNLQTSPFPATTLVKTYSLEECRSAVSALRVSSEETCIVVPTGLMAMDEAIAIKKEFPNVFLCEVGDTGEKVSALASENDIPFVGQMQYQQGFSTITSMHNIIVNYNGGSAWERERGNAALTIDATYECTEECGSQDVKVSINQKERGMETPWLQIGMAIQLEGLDISKFDDYKKENIGKVNKVFLHDGTEVDSIVVDGAANFNAVYAEDFDSKNPKRIYNGLLGEHLQFYPLYERNVDGKRNKCQYFVVHGNGTRIALGEVPKVLDGSFVRMKHTGTTFKLILYDQDEIVQLQKILKGSLGNKCAPCN